MQNIICPVSSDRVLEAQPRVSALLVIALLGLFLFTQLWIVPLFLAFDFYIRGYTKGRYSIVGRLSNIITLRYFNNSTLIDKAPKIFAARLGMVFSIVIFILSIVGLQTVAFFFSFVLILFAGIECFLNFCIGCYIYSLLIVSRINRI